MTLKPEMSNELRHMVRDVLREVMAQRGQPAGGSAVETVRISNDQTSRPSLRASPNPAMLEKVRERASSASRSVNFRCPSGRFAPSAAALTGVITEQKIDHLKGAGTPRAWPRRRADTAGARQGAQAGPQIERRR
jgi:hypothetical protein